MGSIFDTGTDTHEKEIERKKELITSCCIQTLQEIKDRHSFIFNLVWTSPDVTPQEIMDAYGPAAYQLFTFSSAIQQMLASTGTGYVPMTPPKEFTINPDGTVTIVPIVPPATPEVTPIV